MNEKSYENQTFENLKMNEETIENREFLECKFINCSFESCKFIRCTFSECIFQKCHIVSPKAEYTQMSFSEFVNCSLLGVDWNQFLPTGRLSKPISEMHTCRLKYNTFSEISFIKFDFSGSEISDSMFAKCTLTESKFSDCQLNRTEFFHCDLRKSNFTNATGYQIDIFNCKVKDAKFSYPEVVNLLSGLGIKIDV